MNSEKPRDFKIPIENTEPERDAPVVKFRYRPRRQAASNRTALLVGGAALIVVVILLLKLF